MFIRDHIIRRRGLTTGYVRALECLWGLVFQSIRGSEETVTTLLENTSRKAFWLRDDRHDASNRDEPPFEMWRLSRAPQLIDAILSSNDDTDDDDAQPPSIATYIRMNGVCPIFRQKVSQWTLLSIILHSTLNRSRKVPHRLLSNPLLNPLQTLPKYLRR